MAACVLSAIGRKAIGGETLLIFTDLWTTVRGILVIQVWGSIFVLDTWNPGSKMLSTWQSWILGLIIGWIPVVCHNGSKPIKSARFWWASSSVHPIDQWIYSACNLLMDSSHNFWTWHLDMIIFSFFLCTLTLLLRGFICCPLHSLQSLSLIHQSQVHNLHIVYDINALSHHNDLNLVPSLWPWNLRQRAAPIRYPYFEACYFSFKVKATRMPDVLSKELDSPPPH